MVVGGKPWIAITVSRVCIFIIRPLISSASQNRVQLLLIYKREHIVAFIASLLLFVAQFESLVHAADHPFHAEDEICAAFAAFEQHDHAIAVLPATHLHPHSTCEPATSFTSVFVDDPSLIYQSRAPPLHT